MLTLALAAAMSIACSGKTENTPATDSGPAGDSSIDTAVGDAPSETSDAPAIPAGALEACAAYYEPICAQWEKCNPVRFPDYVGTHANCVARAAASCSTSFDDPGVVSTPELLKKCAASIAGLTCSQYFRMQSNVGPLTPECAAIAKGTLPTGSNCGAAFQCASNYCEYPTTDATCGKCTDRIPKGGSCFVTHPRSCEYGSECFAGKCVGFAELGADCNAAPCHIDLQCTAGKCAARAKDGDACEFSSPSTFDCEWNHWCNRVTSKCESEPVAKLGEKCGYDATAGTLTHCDATSRCNITNKTAYTGTCVAPAKLGAACTFNGPGDSQCEYPAGCFDGTCKYRVNGVLCK